MNTQPKRGKKFMLVVDVVGLILSLLTFRNALLQDDNFRIFTSIIWFVLFGIALARNINRLKGQAADHSHY